MFNKLKSLLPKDHCDKILSRYAANVVETVPPFFIGTWRRNYIINHEPEYSVDASTTVIWLQTGSKFSDIRVTEQLSQKYFNNSAYNTWNDYRKEELIHLSKNVLADAGTCNCSIKNVLTYHNEWNNISSTISNNLTISPIIPTHLAGKIVTPTIDSNTKEMGIHLPIANWNANICNYQLYSQYPMPGIITKHETMEDIMFEQPPGYEYLEEWQTLMTSHNFDNTSDNNNNNSKSSAYAYLSLIKETRLNDNSNNDNNILRNTGAILVDGNENCIVCRSRTIDCDKKIKNIIKENEKEVKENDKVNLTQVMNLLYDKTKDVNDLIDCVDSEYSWISWNDQKQCFENQLSSIPHKVGDNMNDTLFEKEYWTFDQNNGNLIEIDEKNQLKREWKLETIWQL